MGEPLPQETQCLYHLTFDGAARNVHRKSDFIIGHSLKPAFFKDLATLGWQAFDGIF